MGKLLFVLAVVMAGSVGGMEEADRLQAAKEAAEDLRILESLTNQEPDQGSSRSAVGDKMKEFCTCASHKECTCCLKQSIDIPLVFQTFSLKACAVVVVQPNEKQVSVKINLGPFTAMEKVASWSSIEEVCRTMQLDNGVVELKHLEGCAGLDVTEREGKGLSACPKLRVRVQGVLEKRILLPCLNFNDHRLTVDDNFVGRDESAGTVGVNLVDLWNKITGKKPKPE